MNSIAGLQKIFPSIKDESDLEHLSRVTSEHPYFSIAQLYLLHESKNKLSFSEKQAAKTALFFNNVHWLNWQLNQADEESDVPDHTETAEENTKEISPVNLTEAGDGPVPALANAVTEINEEEIAFEPLHTIDYFASLGIKLSEEPVATDKLGTQMKSFTEWLKSMKKIHNQKLAPADEQTDKKIQNIAEDSNTNAEVVTEAMADVLVKQNKIEKAIEMYHQLSLINPLKSTYFAGKIESLSTGRQNLKTP